LHLAAEHEYPVPPLELPDPRHLPEVELLSQYDAVTLFIERSQAAKPGFHITGENAQSLAEEGLALSRSLGYRKGVGKLVLCLGNAAVIRGAFVRAERFYREALSVFEDRGDRYWIAAALNDLAYVAANQGEGEEAIERARESLTITQDLGCTLDEAGALDTLAEVAFRRGDLHMAATAWQESLRIADEVGSRRVVAHALEGLAQLLARQGELYRAASLLGCTATWREATALRRRGVERPQLDEAVNTTQAQLDEATWTKAWEEGRAMTLEEAAALAMERVVAEEVSFPHE
jgi:tetratricopeptide (TPR) repeat protein